MQELLIMYLSQILLGIFIILLGTGIVAMAHIVRNNWKENTKADEYLEEFGEKLIDNGETILFKDEVSSVSIPNVEVKPKRPVGRPKKEQNNV